MCMYIIIDAICLLYMSLATYCVLKLCLTGTWKVSIDPQTNKWRFTTQGVPYRLRRYLACLILIPLVITYDICYQVLFLDQVQDYFKLSFKNENKEERED